MDAFLPFLLGLAMFATLLILLVGVVSFAVHGNFYMRHANHLMRLRIVAQGVAVAILALMVYLSVA